MSDSIKRQMLEKFDGCDGGDPGSPQSPSVWLFGIEHGWPQKNDHEPPPDNDASYSIDMQRQWPYNRNAFKLLAAMHGIPVEEYLTFAYEAKPFVAGSQGYFKGNLYPYACHSVSAWPEKAAKESGFEDKQSYQAWCNEHRLPAIKSWADEYQPSIFIGTGNSYARDFSQACYGKEVSLEEQRITINGHTKKIFMGNEAGRKLVVIPHLSGGRNGLNSDAALTQTGGIIRAFMNA